MEKTFWLVLDAGLAISTVRDPADTAVIARAVSTGQNVLRHPYIKSEKNCQKFWDNCKPEFRPHMKPIIKLTAIGATTVAGTTC